MGRLNRIYIRTRDIAESMYKRSKERGFTTEDVMRLHWNRQGHDAIEWARLRVKRLRAQGVIEHVDAELADKRRVLYRFTEAVLQQWGLDK